MIDTTHETRAAAELATSHAWREPRPIDVVSYPTSLGATWTEGDVTVSLVVLRGHPNVYAYAGRWALGAIVAPERYGPIPTDAASMRRFAQAYAR